MSIAIRQPPIYVNLAAHLYEHYEPYDHVLVVCDYDGCIKLCEKGIGMCDFCIDKITNAMSQDLDEVLNGK